MPRFAQEHQFRSKSEKLFKKLKSFAQEVLALERDKQKTIGTGSKVIPAFFCFVYYSKDMTIAMICQFMLGTAASSGKLLLERELKVHGSKMGLFDV